MSAIPKDGWYANPMHQKPQLWGPTKYLRSCIATWGDCVYQRFEEGVCVVSIDGRHRKPSKPEKLEMESP